MGGDRCAALNRVLHENPFSHISTFGGSEVGCYAAREVLDILQEPEFLPHVRKMAGLFHDGFTQLKDQYPELLVEIRQRGLMIGLKLSHPSFGPMLTLAGLKFGLLTIYANHDQSVNQMLPPQTIQENEVAQIIETLDRMLGWLRQSIATQNS